MIHIVHDFKDAPWGGGNQFLKSLKKELIKKEAFSCLESSKYILFNSHQKVDSVRQIKKKYPNKKFIHRVDGPMRLYNNMSDTRDDIVYCSNKELADGTIFQSHFSYHSNMDLGMNFSSKHTIIPNFCDLDLFQVKQNIGQNKKTRIISSSFSDNPKKGFGIYKFLDKNLNFNQYDYVFLGRSPVLFDHIQHIGCLSTKDVAKQLYNSDIYITASQNDPCSNSLIEAQAVGLPTIVLDSGGHPEIVNDNSEVFKDESDLLIKLQMVNNNLADYFSKKSRVAPSDVTDRYIDFIKTV